MLGTAQPFDDVGAVDVDVDVIAVDVADLDAETGSVTVVEEAVETPAIADRFAWGSAGDEGT